MKITYKDNFAVHGLVTKKDVVQQLSEIDGFLDGYFFCLSSCDIMEPLYPVFQDYNMELEQDEDLMVTRIRMEVIVDFKFAPESYKMDKFQTHFDMACNAFFSSRFPKGLED